MEDFFSICFSSSTKPQFADPVTGDDGEGTNKEEILDLSLVSLPMIVAAIRPFAQELPMFLLRLATEVDFDSPEESTMIH